MINFFRLRFKLQEDEQNDKTLLIFLKLIRYENVTQTYEIVLFGIVNERSVKLNGTVSNKHIERKN